MVSGVSATVYNLLGQSVHTEFHAGLSAGRYNMALDFDDLGGHSLASGVYFLSLTFGDDIITRKMNYVK